MEENRIVKVKWKRICGKEYFYPENETSKTVLSLCQTGNGRRKALTVSDIETLKVLGFEIIVLMPKISYEENND